jgi:putative phosphoesterase
VRVAAISDTHLPRGERRLPRACLERLEAADAILHAGDFTSITALEELRSLGPPLYAVFGNVDDPAVVAELPGELVVELGGMRIALVHDAGPAAGRATRLLAHFHDVHAVLYGHTHEAHVERVAGVWILNPGSPTERRRAPARSMLELKVEGGTIEPELVVVGP